MKILSKHEIRVVENTLMSFLPRSKQVFGCVFLMNRLTADPMDVIVDAWPDFNTVLCRPLIKTYGDLFKDMSLFTKDEASLRKFLAEPGIINWENFFCLGADLLYENILRAEAERKGIHWSRVATCYFLELQDISSLPPEDRPPLRMSSLDDSHVDLVNQTWKFGLAEHSIGMIRNMIRHFPSCCLWDEEGRVVAWILTYSTGAMGMLYTIPEHRGKGYARALVSTMSRRMHSKGFPVYCYIEEENKVSYNLYKKLGFVEYPAHREAWYLFNEL